ncbi:5-oxoprolinase subunit PxpB [Campylobacter jejuni]|nr:5-oxoprolinase subunit PxpB [Campylobacter jejuni]MDN2888750.1 5-oxoprolinase subunit PxpB [Campylobacter jejuni]HEH5627644.1 5-oxoprolinase subunit PxpB [Campylobacter jejuni]HEH5673918.1 5-oxoprolinase subunit PxpB [Campylobacter jejuni]HEH5740799.1 5-oxoprolinase subunit PxpB [Campylobacter jejuni]
MFSVHFSGSKALLLRFEQEISPQINAYVLSTEQRIQKALKEGEIYGIDELASAYASLLIYFNPCVLSLNSLLDFLEKIKKDIKLTEQNSSLCIEVPLCYDEEFGLDLEFVCKHNQISKEELISLHTKPYYLVFMLGFMAGFPYLGGLDERLFTPRLSSPRTKIEAGSVGIADKQTGVYPISSPGGWQIIARTPLEFFDKEDEKNPTLLKAGMFLKFKAISKDEFFKIQEQVTKKVYQKEIYEYKNH